MHHQRVGAIPHAYEAQQIADVFLGRCDVALDVVGDVVHVEQQMILGHDRRRPVHQRNVLDQSDDMTRTGFAHCVVQAGKRTDMNHQEPFSASKHFK